MSLSWIERLATFTVCVAVIAYVLQLGNDSSSQSKSGTASTPKQASASKAATSTLDRMGLDRLLVLRVERFAHRSKDLEADAAKLNVPLEFFAASDGHNDPRFRARIVPSLYKNSTCTNLIGAIFDTHERAWRVAAQSKKPILLVEDDIRLPDNFLELWKERMDELPKDFALAFIGSSVRKGDGTTKYSKHLSRLVHHDPQRAMSSPLLGFWGYIVSPRAAKKLLRLVEQERQAGWMFIEPVDLFTARRNAKVGNVFIFEPPNDMNAEFERNPDRHHVIESHRQIGIVSLAKVKSLNNATAGAEQDEMSSLMTKQVELGEAKKETQAWKLSDKSFRRMRKFSCWGTAPLLRNAGLMILRHLDKGEESKIFPKGLPRLPSPLGKLDLGTRTLLLAYELFTGGIRFNGGTWLETKGTEEVPGWIRYSLHARKQAGLPSVDLSNLPGGADAIKLVDGFRLFPHEMRLREPLRSLEESEDDAPPSAASSVSVESKVELPNPATLGEFG